MLLDHKRNFYHGGKGWGCNCILHYFEEYLEGCGGGGGVLTKPSQKRESWQVEWRGEGPGTKIKNYYEGYFVCLAHRPYKAILILIFLQ